MGEKSEKLAHFKGQELTVAEPSEGTLAHFIIQGSVQSAPDDKIAYVSTYSYLINQCFYFISCENA